MVNLLDWICVHLNVAVKYKLSLSKFPPPYFLPKTVHIMLAILSGGLNGVTSTVQYNDNSEENPISRYRQHSMKIAYSDVLHIYN